MPWYAWCVFAPPRAPGITFRTIWDYLGKRLCLVCVCVCVCLVCALSATWSLLDLQLLCRSKMSKSSSSKSSSSPPCNLSSNPASRPHLQLQVLHSTCELTSVSCHLLHHCHRLAICRLRFRSFFKSIPIGIPASQHPSLKFSICILSFWGLNFSNFTSKLQIKGATALVPAQAFWFSNLLRAR